MSFDLMERANGMLRDVQLGYEHYKPEIFMWGGIVGIVGATVLACRATRKIDDISKTHKEAMENNRKKRADFEEKQKTVSVTPEDVQTMENELNKETVAIFGKTVIEVGKAYAIPVILGAASIYSIVHSHNIMRDRNTELASLAAAGTAAFNEYRAKVRNRYGKEVDQEFRHGVSKTHIVTEETDPETGEKTVKEKDVMVSETEEKRSHEPHDLRYVFDARSREFDQRHPKMNVRFLRLQERYANDLIRSRAATSGNGRGFLFLAEVLRELFPGDNEIGMQPWEQTMCWVYDEKNPVGDNYVDFGVFWNNDPSAGDFIEGLEEVVWLDFNCDGSIYQFV